MTHTELLEIIKNGENSGVEFKRDVVENHALAKELVALANLRGGMVLLGVEDDGSISGLTRPDIEEWVMTTCRDKIRPPMVPFFEIVRDVQPGKDVAVVSVTRGYGVHSLWHNNRNTYFIRVGTQSRDPSQEELGRLFQRRGTFRAELRPVSGATLIDLDRRRLRDYFSRIRQQDTPSDTDDAAWQTLLINSEIMTEEGVSVAGMLLFGKNPNRFLPFAGIDAVAFPGTEKDYAARERSGLRGPLVPLLGSARAAAALRRVASRMTTSARSRRARTSPIPLIENGIVEYAEEFVRRNTPVTATLENGATRVERPAFPPEAVREAIVNALVHRDYLLTSTDIELAIYSDRLEVVSPGRLPNDITPDRMRTGCRAARNQLLKDVMRDYGYLEHMGMGIPRKIILGMKAHNGTEPDLLEGQEQFTLRLFA